MKRLRRRKTLIWFTHIMEKVLQDNDYKGGWTNCSDAYLLRKLNEEVDELKLVVWNEKRPSNAIVREAADVANIAMMIADNNSGEKNGVNYGDLQEVLT